MGKIMEALFCIFYLVFVTYTGIRIVVKGKSRKEFLLFGIMSLVLVGGDSFHLVPRILVAFHPAGDYHVALGLGKLVTSITMTGFYLILYYVYGIRYSWKNRILESTMILLAVCRIALCLFPQNDWTGAAPVLWGIYRNIPFTVMGIIMVILYFRQRSDASFRLMWLAITLSFAFYIPVVLWADVHPLIGMLMLPKTCMYIWAVLMGKKECFS
ncbi:MAG: hypothetical protein MJ178_05675 [Treponemataceae bacterium]|nr:hypothetical protein [Treponemataceae bacterium]